MPADDLSWLTARPIAHRGLHDGNRECWENTLSAFARAADAGYAIECDVHLAGDGELVVFHDDALDRLTGRTGFVWQRTGAELAALPIGGTADRVPLLGQVLELIAGRVPLVIELKGAAGHDEGLVERAAAALEKYSGDVAVMSFDHWLVRRFPQAFPSIPFGLTAWGSEPELIEAHFSMLAHGLSFVSYEVEALPNHFVSFVREKLAMPVVTWTVRDEQGVEATRAHADQITFEGFLPETVSLV